MKTVAIIQARMNSSRLPGKVCMLIKGKPMLYYVVERTKQAKILDEVIVATSTLAEDDVIESYCKQMEWKCFRGKSEDVLDRYYNAAIVYKADYIVRVTADCPLIDPGVVDKAVNLMKEKKCDYVSNCIPKRSFPRGLDVGVVSFTALQKAWNECDNMKIREHVTYYISQHPEKFKCEGFAYSEDLSEWRLTVDTKEDFLLVGAIMYSLKGIDFKLNDVVDLLKSKPKWLELNKKIKQNEVVI